MVAGFVDEAVLRAALQAELRCVAASHDPAHVGCERVLFDDVAGGGAAAAGA